MIFHWFFAISVSHAYHPHFHFSSAFHLLVSISQVWKFHRQVKSVDKGTILRIQADKSFKLQWSNDNWHTKQELESINVAELSLEYVDLKSDKLGAIEFTFFWTDSNSWEEDNYTVEIK